MLLKRLSTWFGRIAKELEKGSSAAVTSLLRWLLLSLYSLGRVMQSSLPNEAFSFYEKEEGIRASGEGLPGESRANTGDREILCLAIVVLGRLLGDFFFPLEMFDDKLSNHPSCNTDQGVADMCECLGGKPVTRNESDLGENLTPFEELGGILNRS